MTASRAPALTPPADFERFWARTRAELDEVPAAVRREPGGERRGKLELEELSFASLEGMRVRGYLIRSPDDRPRPLVVHSHGYGGEAARMWSWAERGLDVAGIDIRGHGASIEGSGPLSVHGYALTGAESPDTYVLRGAVCDYMRAVEVARAELRGASSRTVLTGTSFAGGLATMAEAQLQVADLLVLAVPSLGWTEGRRALAGAGSGADIEAYLTGHPDRERAVMAALGYFDTMNFAGLLRCPTLVGLGLRDNVVPPETVQAIVGHLRAPHELVELPVSHTESPEERRWELFEEEWLRLASSGVPPGFGSTPPVPRRL